MKIDKVSKISLLQIPNKTTDFCGKNIMVCKDTRFRKQLLWSLSFSFLTNEVQQKKLL